MILRAFVVADIVIEEQPNNGCTNCGDDSAQLCTIGNCHNIKMCEKCKEEHNRLCRVLNTPKLATLL